MSGFAEFCCYQKTFTRYNWVFIFTELLAQPHIGEIESFVLHCNTQNYKLFLCSVKPRQSGEKWCCGIPEQLQEIVVVSLLFCFM